MDGIMMQKKHKRAVGAVGVFSELGVQITQVYSLKEMYQAAHS